MYMKITIYLRKPDIAFSLEGIVNQLKCRFENDKDIELTIARSSYSKSGLINIIRAMLEARKFEGDVNHISGDIHYITYLLNAKKTITTMHDCEKLICSDFGLIKKYVYKLLWFTIPAMKSCYITTATIESRNRLVQYAGINKDKIVIIGHGVGSAFKRLSDSEKISNDILGNKNKKKLVLHVSGVQPNKNVERIILSLRDMNIKFVKVGYLSEKEKELLLENKIDYINFLNVEVEFLVRVYNSVDCLIFPSTVEGFGLPVIEAQACGCPVVTSNCSTLPEVAGTGAFFVDPYSIVSIKEGIENVLHDDKLRKVLINNGCENIKRFNWDVISSKYKELYKKVYDANHT